MQQTKALVAVFLNCRNSANIVRGPPSYRNPTVNSGKDLVVIAPFTRTDRFHIRPETLSATAAPFNGPIQCINKAPSNKIWLDPDSMHQQSSKQ